MNKKVLVITVALIAVAMLATPMVGAAQACGCRCRCRREPPQSFEVTLGATKVSLEEKTYWPNKDNPNVIVQRWGNNLQSCVICIGGDLTYSWTLDPLDQDDFEYDQECVLIAVGAPFSGSEATVQYGSKSDLWIITYEYDFSAVPGGIDGVLKMLFVYKDEGFPFINWETSIRSLWGTGDLRNVKITAAAPTMSSHEGTVTGWPDIP